MNMANNPKYQGLEYAFKAIKPLKDGPDTDITG